MKISFTKSQVDYHQLQEQVALAHQQLHSYQGLGNEYTGWLELPVNIDQDEVQKVKELARKITSSVDVLVVCGIGGSYLGARMVIEAINGLKLVDGPEILYMGNTFSAPETADLLVYLRDKKFAVNVISKSGTTTETAIAFRLLRELLKSQHGNKFTDYIYATTDPKSGVLRQMAEKEGYPTLTIPRNIGGRYSVLTSVGLLPIAVAGIDIDQLLQGAADAYHHFNTPDLNQNICYQYAATRMLLEKTKKIEVLVTYEPRLVMLGEWYKQLFGESEGKDGKGLFPAAMTFSTDLHSLGQYVQDGQPLLFETILNIEQTSCDVFIPATEDYDGLNYLAGKYLDDINTQARLGTLEAHADSANVPCICITLDRLDAYNLGYFIYFMEKSCAISGYLAGVNPFIQEGVEVYKKNMFKRLGKPS